MSAAPNALFFSENSPTVAPLPRNGTLHHHPGLNWVEPVRDVNGIAAPAQEALLIGRHDRYRAGDLLMSQAVSRLCHFSRVRCAGLVASDQTPWGGHAVRNFGESALEMGGSGLQLVHVGGDLLGIDLITAYGSTVEGDEQERFENLLQFRCRTELTNFVRRRSGQTGELAYVLAPEGDFSNSRASFHAVGLAEPEKLDDATREQLLATLRAASFVGVRDENGAEYLEAAGVPVERMPCALSVLPQACARPLREARDRAPLAAMRARFPNGWIAVEVSRIAPADQNRLIEALRQVSSDQNLGLVFFYNEEPQRTEAIASLRTWADAYPEWQAAVFPSKNIWDVASLLLHARLYCGSSVSCRVIAMSGGVARINVPDGTAEARSYGELWEHDAVPIEFAPEENWAEALSEALAVDLIELRTHAAWLHRRYFASFGRFCRATGLTPVLAPVEKQTDHVQAVQDFASNQALTPESVGMGSRTAASRSFVRTRAKQILGGFLL